MSAIFVMLPAALLLGVIAVVAFVLTVKSGQFDDLDTPAMRAVFDDEPNPVDESVDSHDDQISR